MASVMVGLGHKDIHRLLFLEKVDYFKTTKKYKKNIFMASNKKDKVIQHILTDIVKTLAFCYRLNCCVGESYSFVFYLNGM